MPGTFLTWNNISDPKPEHWRLWPHRRRSQLTLNLPESSSPSYGYLGHRRLKWIWRIASLQKVDILPKATKPRRQHSAWGFTLDASPAEICEKSWQPLRGAVVLTQSMYWMADSVNYLQNEIRQGSLLTPPRPHTLNELGYCRLYR